MKNKDVLPTDKPSKEFLGNYKNLPVYYHPELRSCIACTTDEECRIYDYIVPVKNFEQAIQMLKAYGAFSFEN
jgi:hypothetical protein